jgi:proton-dependent oligopeptide transporter, POT family
VIRLGFVAPGERGLFIMSQADVSQPIARGRTFLGHPVGLYILFFTEMWERFSFYGMKALLMLYMVNYFKWTQKDASFYFKWYTSLVYLTPLLGGYLADRYLGNRKAVIIGALLMAIGHFLMAFEALSIFFAALIFLIMGNGFFKPNMSTQVGRLYTQNDPRRDGAYTIFYMGINLGAFLSPLACGWLAENTMGGYHSGFTLAGIGMVFGLLIYVFGLPMVHELDAQTKTPEKPGAGIVPPTVLPGTTGISATKAPENIRIEDDSPRSPLMPDRTEPSAPGIPEKTGEKDAMSEAEAANTPAVFPHFTKKTPEILCILGALFVVLAPSLALLKWIAWDNAISLLIASVALFIGAWITSHVRLALRERVLAIFVLFFFVIFFWAAFEQAGNVLNLWADKTTDRQMWGDSRPPALYPDVPKEEEKEEASLGIFERFTVMFKLKPKKVTSPSEEAKDAGFLVPTAWFQSINALAIFILAPVFAVGWVYLARRKINISIPTKMAMGLVLMALSLFIMVFSAKQQDMPTETKLVGGKLPAGVAVNDKGQLCSVKTKDGFFTGEPNEPYHAGQITLDAATEQVKVRGVFPDTERDRILRETAPNDFVDRLAALMEVSVKAPRKGQPAKTIELDLPRKPSSDPKTWFPDASPTFTETKEDDKTKYQLKVTVALPVTLNLGTLPPGYDHRYAGLKTSIGTFDEKARTLTVKRDLLDKDAKGLQVAASDPKLRTTLDELMVKSSKYRVSMWWLFWVYILATLGELCLSPVGLSMVSKLAPAKFATMLMGMWLLTSYFGNFVAGACGELYESVPPTEFFTYFVVILAAASALLFLLARMTVKLMHGVK